MKPYIMKNFQVKHGQCDNTTFLQNIIFWRLSVIARPLPCWQQDSVLLICPRICLQIYQKLHVLQCLFVRGSNKKQRRGRIISNFTKGEAFHLLWQPSALAGNLTMWPSFLHPPKNNLPFSFTLAKKKTYLETWLKGGAYWFVLKTACVFPIPSGRVRIGW